MRMMIQWESSHFLAGKVMRPKVAPACNSTVSPHDAFSIASEASSPARTRITFPGAGVSRIEVCITTLGNSAGPSKFPLAGAAVPRAGVMKSQAQKAKQSNHPERCEGEI